MNATGPSRANLDLLAAALASRDCFLAPDWSQLCAQHFGDRKGEQLLSALQRFTCKPGRVSARACCYRQSLSLLAYISDVGRCRFVLVAVHDEQTSPLGKPCKHRQANLLQSPTEIHASSFGRCCSNHLILAPLISSLDTFNSSLLLCSSLHCSQKCHKLYIGA